MIDRLMLTLCLFGAMVLLYVLSGGAWGMVDIQATVTLPADASWWQIAGHVLREYFWHLLSLLVSPLAGFSGGQMYKISVVPKPPAARIALVSGGITAALSFVLWPGGWDEKAKIAVTIGLIQPLIVWVWFAAAERFAPKQAMALKGSNGSVTILPWVQKRKSQPVQPRRDGAPVDFNVTEDPTEPK